MQLLFCTVILLSLIAVGVSLLLFIPANAKAAADAIVRIAACANARGSQACAKVAKFVVVYPALLISLIFSSHQTASAQTPGSPATDTIGVSVYFPQGYSKLVPSYRDNSKQLHDFVERVDRMHADPSVKLTSIDIISYASPEGSYTLNMKLVRRRAANIVSFLKREMPYIPDDLYKVEPKGINWEGLTRMVEESDMQYRGEVLNILRNTPERTYRNGRLVDSRLKQLMELRRGKPYWYMFEHFFPTMRAAGAYVVCNYVREAAPVIEPEPIPEDDDTPDILADPYTPDTLTAPSDTLIEERISETLLTYDEAPESPDFHRYGYVKTNIPAYGMLWLNAAIEFDFAEHWSAQLPIYYSGWNYFTSRRKFRTFAVVPEIRLWTSPENRGFFVGAHFGMAYYNAAFGGDFRYQDHNGNTPALGGGISLGARIPLSGNRRWWLEFSVGAGIYRLDYDRFINEHNGLLFDRRKRTFYGIDNAAISIAYRFSLERKRKGGEL